MFSLENELYSTQCLFSFNTSPGCCTIFIESFALLGICDKDRKPNEIYFRSALLTFFISFKIREKQDYQE